MNKQQQQQHLQEWDALMASITDVSQQEQTPRQTIRAEDLPAPLRDILCGVTIAMNPDGSWHQVSILRMPDPESPRERYRRQTIEQAKRRAGDAS